MCMTLTTPRHNACIHFSNVARDSCICALLTNTICTMYSVHIYINKCNDFNTRWGICFFSLSLAPSECIFRTLQTALSVSAFSLTSRHGCKIKGGIHVSPSLLFSRRWRFITRDENVIFGTLIHSLARQQQRTCVYSGCGHHFSNSPRAGMLFYSSRKFKPRAL
jgi:hypothetical protein